MAHETASHGPNLLPMTSLASQVSGACRLPLHHIPRSLSGGVWVAPAYDLQGLLRPLLLREGELRGYRQVCDCGRPAAR